MQTHITALQIEDNLRVEAKLISNDDRKNTYRYLSQVRSEHIINYSYLLFSDMLYVNIEKITHIDLTNALLL